MPHVEPLGTATVIAVAGLFVTVAALWIRRWWVLLGALLVTELAGFVPRDPDTAGCLIELRGGLAGEPGDGLREA